MNVFGDEVAHYDALSDTWHDKEGSIQNLRQFGRFKARWLRPFLTPHKLVLDVGCGGGYLSEALLRVEPTLQVDAIDISAETIERNKQHQTSSQIRFWTSDIDKLPPKPTYDWVLLSELLEHVPRPLALLDSANTRLKSGGYLFVATPARTRLSQIALIGVAERILQLLPRGSHHYNRFIARKEVKRHLEKAGFDVVKEAGTLMNPLSKTFHLWPLKSVHYMILARKQ